MDTQERPCGSMSEYPHPADGRRNRLFVKGREEGPEKG